MIKDFEKTVEGKYQKETIEYNLHTHNYLCGHAQGTVKDYAKVAVDNGLKLIGISDHGRPPIENFEHYITLKEIKELYLPQFDEASSLYKDKIIIKKGLEIEYFSGHNEFYKELLKNLDYLVLGQHIFLYKDNIEYAYRDTNDFDKASFYFDNIIEGIKSGFFKVVAHADFLFGRYSGPNINKLKEKLEECVKACIENNVLVEINVNGYRHNGFTYPTDELIEICKKLNAKVVIGSDNHTPDSLVDESTKKIVTYCKIKGLNIAKFEDIKI